MNFPAATVAGSGVVVARIQNSFLGVQATAPQVTTIKAENLLLDETPLGNH